MIYNLIIKTKGKRLFTQKNIIKNNLQKEKDEVIFNDIKDARIISRFSYHSTNKNWINIETGELFISDEMIERIPQEMKEQKNYLELNKFFKNNSIIIPKSFPIDFGEQLTIL